MTEPDQVNVSELIANALLEIDASDSIEQTEALRVKWLGKKGTLTSLLKGVGRLPAEMRRDRGQEINNAKRELESRISERHGALEDVELERKLTGQRIDVTLPGRKQQRGGLHPITRSAQRIENIFATIGFDIADGPEIEDDVHNFQALNIPPDHPARAMQDTFYIDDQMLLRTHTSPVQIRYMESHEPPLRVIAPGRVYRVDSDLTHTPMFHQVEGLAVDTDISFADLKGVLTYFCRAFFETEVDLRFRSSYFPFTEPSAEVDISCFFCKSKGCRICSHTGWLEILGCGMVHPNVLKHVGVDSERYTGYAFGMGIERVTMLRYGVNDLRTLFENELSFLDQFKSA